MRKLYPLYFALLLGFGLYWFLIPQSKVNVGPIAEERASMERFIRHPAPKDLGAFTFVDGAGKVFDQNVFKGKVTVLNLWATWCAPCRKEMPDLAALQKDLGGADFQVVALSEDLKGYDASSAFLKSVGAENLVLYIDENAEALDALKAPGLPVTLLLNKQGQEVGRVIGPAPWGGDEAKALVRGVMTKD